MSRIEQLLKEHCPDGVEKKRVDEICTITRGHVISKDYITENAGAFPVYSSQTENNGELGRITTYDFDGEYLTWTTDGANAGTVFYRTGKFSVTNVCGLLKVNVDNILTRYLYYTLSVEAPKYVNSGMGNPKLMSNVMARVTVPVPPIEVQSEIVRILDNFTELTAELTARKKQYEYYRDLWLDGLRDPKVSLGDIISVERGVRVVRDQLSEDEGYPVYQNSLAPLGYHSESNRKGGQTYLIGAGAAGDIGYSDVDFWAADDCYTFICPETVNNRFLYHCLSNQQSLIYSKVRRSSIPRLSRDELLKLKLSIPPLSVQKRVVKVLDNFDAICSNLNIGLPAEIEARRKQYEYYRDKLLTFKEV